MKSTNKPVNPIELFTYKILEYLEYGSEVRFFYDDAQNFYIATKDVSTYSNNGSVSYYLTFLTEDFNDFKPEIKTLYPKDEENEII